MQTQSKRPLIGLLSFCCLLAFVPACAQEGMALGDGTAMYPRVVRQTTTPAKPLVASVTAFEGGAHADIFRSDDDGVTFTKVSEIRDPDFAGGLCCGGLYALPVAVGALKAGTLLYASSVGQGIDNQPMRLKIHRSDDSGVTWSNLSICYTAPVQRKGGGLWEVEFLLTANGQLGCLFSDETVPGHSQILQQSLSSDGIHWSAPKAIVKLAPSGDRPGMPVVSRLGDGRFFMTYEICGPGHNCDVYTRFSADGVDWGDPADAGQQLVTPDGFTLRATPTHALARGSGRLIVTGQRVYRGGVHQKDAAVTLFVDDSGTGAGPWRMTPAPVDVRDIPADGNVCQNYSSPVLASEDGASILSIVTDYSDGKCRARFGTVRLSE
ncbi:BNR/Asp-box repeat family protein [Asticcacaulis biprosthecium C19]|uniref:BNR/Asp-box repeat family protein n=1 Tax=Asticcacaulis biprosthecium C19 TaxID=715226 RepID=F4QJF2_9CAUL|nr:sialidase family protein [Asticcacaulis biprosthecium]EGF93135.1 BNR/Asp-box repeat family protein [Asticcacaulis biprosthecium C19]